MRGAKKNKRWFSIENEIEIEMTYAYPMDVIYYILYSCALDVWNNSSVLFMKLFI